MLGRKQSSILALLGKNKFKKINADLAVIIKYYRMSSLNNNLSAYTIRG